MLKRNRNNKQSVVGLDLDPTHIAAAEVSPGCVGRQGPEYVVPVRVREDNRLDCEVTDGVDDVLS